MKKFPTSKILKGTLIVGALNVVILPAVLVSPSITLSAFEIEQMLLALNNENNKVVSHINKLESNKDSVDTLESSILQTANIVDQANQVLLKYNREDIKSHLKIKAVRDQLESNINELKTKNEAFKPILEQNKLFLNTVVQNAQLTVKKAEDKAKKTLNIDLPGLNEAKLELENALKEVDKAKELAKSSKEHTTNLLFLLKGFKKQQRKLTILLLN